MVFITEFISSQSDISPTRAFTGASITKLLVEVKKKSAMSDLSFDSVVGPSFAIL